MANASWISSGDPYVAFGSSQELPLSSYGVLDSLYEYFTQPTKYPNLQQISYVGFSAGGQMINRYAWASKIGRPLHRIAPNTKGTTETTPGESADISATNVRVRFIVSDASSYLYFDNLRPAGECRASYDTGVSHTCDTFTRYYNSNELPLIHLRGEGFDRTMEEEEEEGVAEVTTCKEFNNWKFGTNIIPGVELGYSYFQPFIDQPDLIKEHTYWYRYADVVYKHINL